MALTSAQGELYGVFITFIILTVIVTALRIYTRMFIKKALGADDSKTLLTSSSLCARIDE